MQKIPFILLSFVLVLLTHKVCGQQYLTERLVELSIDDEKTQEYFEAFNTVFILSNNYCNNNNCRSSILRASKKVMIFSKEDLEQRKMKQYMEFLSIRRNGNKASVKIKFHKGGSTSIKFVQNRGKWRVE